MKFYTQKVQIQNIVHVIPFIKIKVKNREMIILMWDIIPHTWLGFTNPDNKKVSYLNIHNGTNDLCDFSHTSRHGSGIAEGAGTA